MGWELITPDSLAELDSSQNTKLGGVATGADVTGSNTSYDTARVSGTTAATINTGAGRANAAINSSNLVVTGLYSSTYGSSDIHSMVTAQARANAGLASSGDVSRAVPQGVGGTGLTSNSTLLNSNTTKSQVGLGSVPNYSAETMRAGTTSSHVGLSNVPNYSAATMRAGTTASDVGLSNVPNYSAATMRAGTTSSDVGLSNVPNYSAATMMGQNHTGTVNGVSASTVTSGAASGATANQDSTATIRGGVTTASITSGGTSHTWTIEDANSYAPTSTTQTTTIEWRSGTGALLTTATITSTFATSGSISISRSGSGVSYSGSASSPIGASGGTTKATYNSITMSVYHAVIDMTGWTFK